ncbi:hypothetical protein D920_01463, partial [Enterococcus faecalis 13-SD-W-01]
MRIRIWALQYFLGKILNAVKHEERRIRCQTVPTWCSDQNTEKTTSFKRCSRTNSFGNNSKNHKTCKAVLWFFELLLGAEQLAHNL